jgi:two-component sensor histidine kinase
VKSFRKSLSVQMLLALLLLSIVPISSIGFIAFNFGRQIIIENAQTHLKTVGILKKQAIDNWIEHLQHSLFFLTNDPDVIQNVVLSNSTNTSQLTRRIARQSLISRFKQVVSLGHISYVSVIDPSSGQIAVSSEPAWVGKFRESSSFFVHGKDDIFVSEIFLSMSMGRPTMVVSGPMSDSKGNLAGVLAFHADFDSLSTIMLERTGLSETTETFLVNKANLLITNTVFAPSGAFKKWIFGEGAIRAISGKSDVDLFMDYRGKRVIGAYFWLPKRKLALIAKQDVAEAFAPIGELWEKIVFIGLGFVFLIVLAGFLFGHKIVKPIQKLVAGTRAVGKGDLDYRINSSAGNEIGVLSNAFDLMAENLRHITISLDEKEILLREIHHRVKNNLQMVQSLLNLQINQFTDNDVVAPLKDSMHRITSIAMVHETLYKADDLSTINLDTYFQELVNYLMKSLSASNASVDIKCNIEQLAINLDGVIACGLIINELVTNALKYAFGDVDVGIISIDLRSTKDAEATLTVSDNGVGISDLEEISGKNTLGIDLVNILAENQLDGSVELVHDMGLKYIITFPF